MKSLMLLNARKRRKSSRSRPNARRRSRRRSRINPVGYTASYAANFPSGMGKKSRKPRRTLRIKRFRLPSGQAGLTVRARKIYVSRRGRKSAIIVARNPRRRSYRMKPFGGNIMSQVRSVFSKENVTLAGGGLASYLLTRYLLALKKGGDLSGAPLLPQGTGETQKIIRVAYAVGIPLVGSMLTRRFSPALARGMFLGGLINGAQQLFTEYAPPTTKAMFGLSEYLDYTPMSALNATPGYSAINQFSTVRPMNSAFANSSAFPADAWGR